mmetsp:Transcript_16645/g.21648  ORF Transcript_16645/g.21648 Transcript_16645/m.21648 type:complete len:367 (+) Transcript_16645:79-1179(+)
MKFGFKSKRRNNKNLDIETVSDRHLKHFAMRSGSSEGRFVPTTSYEMNKSVPDCISSDEYKDDDEARCDLEENREGTFDEALIADARLSLCWDNTEKHSEVESRHTCIDSCCEEDKDSDSSDHKPITNLFHQIPDIPWSFTADEIPRHIKSFGVDVLFQFGFPRQSYYRDNDEEIRILVSQKPNQHKSSYFLRTWTQSSGAGLDIMFVDQQSNSKMTIGNFIKMIFMMAEVPIKKNDLHFVCYCRKGKQFNVNMSGDEVFVNYESRKGGQSDKVESQDFDIYLTSDSVFKFFNEALLLNKPLFSDKDPYQKSTSRTHKGYGLNRTEVDYLFDEAFMKPQSKKDEDERIFVHRSITFIRKKILGETV